MELEEAKRLMSLQSCITHFCDEFLLELSKLPESNLKTDLVKGMKEVIGVNLTEVIFPIISKHSSLNPYGENPIANQWFKNAKHQVIEVQRKL